MTHQLVIVEQGIKLGIEKEQLVFYRGDKPFKKSKLQDLDQLLLLGQIELSATCRAVLLKKGIDVVFLTSSGQYLGRLWQAHSKQAQLRVVQYQFFQDTTNVLEIAKTMVYGKIKNQRRFLLQAQRSLKADALTSVLANMRIMGKKIEQVNNLDSLRGYEGQAAALYFSVFPSLIKVEGFEMKGRSRRPPRDEVNALLSFGYTILLGHLETIVLKVGLDPYLGCLHQTRHGMPSLVLDLLEEFRPLVVDTLAVRLINQRQLKKTDFYNPDAQAQAEEILWGEEDVAELVQDPRPPVYLSQTGNKIFFRHFYKRLREKIYYPPLDGQYEYLKIMELQAYHLARVIQRKEESYVSFEPR